MRYSYSPVDKPLHPHSFSFEIHVYLGGVLLFLIGAMMHFTYVWTGCQDWAAIPFAVNESVYEHIKIMLFPILAWWCVIFPILFSDIWLEYWSAGTMAIYCATGVLLVGDALLVGLRIESLTTDIILFFVSIVCGQTAGYYESRWHLHWCVVWLFLTPAVVILCVCTNNPPHVPLFEDLRNHTYGRPANCTSG